MQITDLIKELVTALVADKDAVQVTDRRLSRSLNIFIQVGEFDQGKVLGQRRTTLDALTQVAREIGNKEGITVRIELLDPIKTGKGPTPHQFVPAQHWSKKEFVRLLDQVMVALFGSYDIRVEDASAVITIFELSIQKESQQSERRLRFEGALETLFHAIGKSFKHIVHIDLIEGE